MQARKQLKPVQPTEQKQVAGGTDLLQPGETWDEAHRRLLGGSGGSNDSPQQP